LANDGNVRVIGNWIDGLEESHCVKMILEKPSSPDFWVATLLVSDLGNVNPLVFPACLDKRANDNGVKSGDSGISCRRVAVTSALWPIYILSGEWGNLAGTALCATEE
jgi:hypothetical protein